jgi:hypothetical protein
MQITVQLKTDAARHLHRQVAPTAESEELNRITKQFGVMLLPIHPGTVDPDLIRYFTVEAPDQATAQRMIARLEQNKAVEAAYLKPLDVMP